ncbi:unnamed protein product [Hermetia illucens]|uniref:K Homology domain-containing protein n=1 Tax=Hermetia illucens TaxID=343691 RepID=A0A7R8UZF0_HERIL|nr:KH domain-containing, RNA-binding, signal transduction-associated protein 2-like isoform X2 [Hermetia illucens]CAD7088764.1 unnamed protein product [Hermetia illucens]
MTESYEGNGEYNNYNDEETDFKRKVGSGGGSQNENSEEPHNEQPSLNDKANDYIRDCLMEKNKLDKNFPIAERLLEGEIETVQRTGRIPTRDPKYVDIYREKPIRVSQKVLVPIREHPKFNFVGKLLGPKGNSLRRLQEETLCKMTVLGRNSMKDRAKEEELRSSMDPKYAHLNDDLHVEISTIAPPAEAHARMAYAMAELRKYLIPDSNDMIRQEQLRELMDSSGEGGAEFEKGSSGYKPRQPPVSSAVPPRSSYGYRPPAPVSTHPSTTSTRAVMPPKQKVLSILDRARSAMDEAYSRHYDEPISYEAPAYDSYGYGHAPPASSRAPYEVPEYEPAEYRREYYPHSPSYPEKQKLIVKPSSTSSTRPAWKASNSGAASYHHSSSSSSRRHDELHPGSIASSSSKHSSREARYKSAPYPRAK